MVFWRLRYKLSLRDLPEMFLIRGIEFSYEAVRDWEAKLTPSLIDSLRRRRKGRIGRSWYIDETYITVSGRWCYLYRAIDRSGALVDVRLSETRDMAAAKAFFRSAKVVTGVVPARVTTDGHDSYPQAIQIELDKGVRHRTNQYLNNRIEPKLVFALPNMLPHSRMSWSIMSRPAATTTVCGHTDCLPEEDAWDVALGHRPGRTCGACAGVSIPTSAVRPFQSIPISNGGSILMSA